MWTDIPTPKITQKINIIMEDIKKLTTPLMICEITNISLGKYTFLIIPSFAFIEVVPALIYVAKKVHGTIPVIKYTK